VSGVSRQWVTTSAFGILVDSAAIPDNTLTRCLEYEKRSSQRPRRYTQALPDSIGTEGHRVPTSSDMATFDRAGSEPLVRSDRLHDHWYCGRTMDGMVIAHQLICYQRRPESRINETASWPDGWAVCDDGNALSAFCPAGRADRQICRRFKKERGRERRPRLPRLSLPAPKVPRLRRLILPGKLGVGVERRDEG